MQMSDMKDKDKIDDVGFCWGKKRKHSGSTKEVDYESFTYDGVEYFLYDCVYMYKDTNPEAYIGKLIRIWDDPNKGWRVLVLWFFLPSEISNYLGDENVLDREIFLACGDGTGLTNENPLEAISSKCNVVCISRDERNRRPSNEEVKMADYIFYRTFDVGSLTISDKLGEKIASIDVGFLLNKKDIRLLTLGSANSKAYGDSVAQGIQKPLISIEDAREDETLEPDADRISLLVKDDKGENLLNEVKSIDRQDGVELNNRCLAASASTELATASSPGTRLRSFDYNETFLGNVAKSGTTVGMTGVKGFGKSKHPDSVDVLDEKGKKDHDDEIHTGINNVKDSVASKERWESGRDSDSIVGEGSGRRTWLRLPTSNQTSLDNVSKSAANVQISERKSIGESKCVDSVIMTDEKAKKNLGAKAVVRAKDSAPSTSSAIKRKSEIAKDFDFLVNTVQKKKPYYDTSERSLPKKLKLDNSAVPSCTKGSNGTRKSDSHSAPSPSSAIKRKSEIAKDFDFLVNTVQKKKPYCDTSERSLPKKLKLDNSAVPSGTKGSNGAKASRPSAAIVAETNVETKLAIQSNSLSKTLKSKGVMDKSNGKPINASLKKSKDGRIEARGSDKKMLHPPLDKRNWFKPVPWEVRMKESQKEGTLILLQNLDPAYTSAEVEEMILQAFEEICTAKMVQLTAISSPCSGHAFVVFKTREAAEMVINKLKRRCLMLPNGRPLVGSFWVTSFDGKQSQFPGHLVIDKLRRQTQREAKAVSTSHTSQSNSIEYEMALEWRLLQERTDFCWKKLTKLHEEDVKKLVSRLKQKGRVWASKQ